MSKRFKVFSSSTPHTINGFIDLTKSWEFEIEADDSKLAQGKMMREARKHGYVDNDKDAMTIETSDLKQGWQRYSNKQYKGRVWLKPYRYGTGGIYIQEILE